MKDFATSLTRRFLPQFDPEERRMALKVLRRTIDENMFDFASGDGGGEGARDRVRDANAPMSRRGAKTPSARNAGSAGAVVGSSPRRPTPT